MQPRSPHVNVDERPNTLGLPDKSLDALLNNLDEETEGSGSVRRQFSRWPFRRTTLRVTIVHPGGSTVVLKLACRNISRGGIGVLHTCFIHPGSACIVEMPTVSGGCDRLDGTIRRVAHRHGTLHELGIKFSHPIDVSRYVPRELRGWNPSIEHVDPDKLNGTIMYVEPSAPDVESFKMAIKDTNLRVRHVRTGAEALAQSFNEVTLIVCENKLPDMGGPDLLSQLRAAGIKLPFLLLSTDGAGVPTEKLRDFGAALIQKPTPPDLLLRILAEWTLPIDPGVKPAKKAGGGN